MTKDFTDPKVPLLSNEEEIIGVHSSGVKLVEGANTNLKRYYCGNCTKKIHCYVKVEEGEAIIHKTCKNDDCECKCRTHYACKICGYLHPHGIVCDRKDKPVVELNPDTDVLIAEINKEFLENFKEVKVVHK